MRTKLFFSLLAVFFLGILNISAQAPVCGGTFTDPAGPNANYLDNTDYTVTICPTNPGEFVTVTFTAFNIEANWDALYVFNGNSITAPQISSGNPAANVPGGLAGGYWGTVIPAPFTSSSPDGCLTFRFRSDTTINRPGWIANVTCAPPPTCPKPTALTVSAITSTSATLAWTENGAATAWEYIILPAASPAPTADTAGFITTAVNPVVATNLNSFTCYTAYVRAVCSESDSSIWSTGVSFCTQLAPPICGGQFVDNGGPTANYANSSDVTTTICPENAGDVVTVTFSTFNIEANWDALYVFNGNSIAAQQIASSNAAGNVPGGLAGGFWGTAIPEPFTSSSTDGCLTFRFRSDNTANRAGWIANITCAPPPTCPKPNALSVTNISPTSAVLGWSDNTASTWEYLITPIGVPVPLPSDYGVPTSTNPVMVTGLNPNTCYTFYVRAVCSETDSSTWSVGFNFCTPPAPPTCGGLFVDNGGANANYANSSDNTYVICPTSPSETLTIIFNSFDVEATWDALYVFDGNSINAPQISSGNPAGNVPGGLAGGFWGTTPPGPFTSSSPDGCLTFRFRSDNTANRAGWVADVICAADADKILLVAYVDTNNNGIKDTDESLFPNGTFIYQQNDSGININGYSPTGQYAIYDTNPANTYDFSYQLQPEYAAYYSAAATTYSDVNIPSASGTQFLYFPVTLTQAYTDLSVCIAPLSAPRPTLNYQNKIIYKNNGVAATDGTLSFIKPAPVTIATVSQTGITTNPNGFTYNFTNLQPNETRTIIVTMTVPATPTVSINQLLTANASITAPANDIDLANNSNTNSQMIVNSWDPNDKMESHGDKIRINEFTPDDYLFYTIRFQNNGTASAINIRIEDLLDSQLDKESVRMVSASHNYTMRRTDNLLTWEFRNIYLPSSIFNQAGSVGYVQFKVKANPGFQVGDIIPNNASIYFDANPAVVTNFFNTKFINALDTADFSDSNLVLYPNPANNIVEISLVNTAESISKIVLFDMLGKAIKSVPVQSNENIRLDVSNLTKGVYLVEINTENNLKTIKKLVVQ